MEDLLTRSDDSLYDADFYAWTRQQAALIRQGPLAAVDLANILEEIESLGRKEVAELRSRLKVLLLHLLKEIYQPGKSSRSWRTTILNQRLELAIHLADNPSLRSKIDDIFAQAYNAARELAASETGLALTTFPVVPPFGHEEAMSKGWHPSAAVRPDEPTRRED